jgi:hypothetical protein
MLWMFQRVNYGPVTNEKNRNLPDLTPREWALMVPTIALVIVMGIFPGIFLRPMEPSVNRIIERVTASQPARVRLDNRQGATSPVRPVAQVAPVAGNVNSGATISPRAANREPRTAIPGTEVLEPRTTSTAAKPRQKQ